MRIKEDSESRGVGYAKNRAAEMARGRFLCFCDADDLSDPSRIEEQCVSSFYGSLKLV
ncbi:unnamed protein product [Nippostrongylus brasiliensis]|uniref:Glyco_trans_2-like domain-containing protein n=1 Tax=Nippostrongylus brasiliensis TaxID=27835 RepID=A0A0N4XQ24_NIPBR|nr:unnamed protein product [Nippostrongylus brasiliensis]